MIGRWDFRRRLRHRHLRKMSIGSMAGLAPVMMMVLLGLWWAGNSTGYFQSEPYGETRFRETCDKVVFWIEHYRNEHGHLPDSIKVEGLFKNCNWGKGIYVDTTKWKWEEIFYRHWDDSAYTIVSFSHHGRFLSTPEFAGYLFSRWDKERDSARVDTVPVRIFQPIKQTYE